MKNGVNELNKNVVNELNKKGGLYKWIIKKTKQILTSIVLTNWKNGS